MSTNNGFVPLQTPMAPELNPQIAKDLAAYQLAQEEYDYDCKEIQKLAAGLAAMKNPMFGVMMVLNSVMSMSGDQIASLSAVDNLDTDMRNLVQGAQDGFNSAMNDAPDPSNPNQTTPDQQKDSDAIRNNLDQLEAFLKYEQSQGKNSIIDSGTLNTMLQAIGNIKSLFSTDDWNNPGGIAYKINNWAGTNGGQYSTQIKQLEDGFQTSNQSTSALSTSTNTNLQFTTEQFKQYEGIDESSSQSYLKLTSAMIQNEKTN